MTYQQKITHYLGQSIGSLLKVFKWHLKKPKSNLTSSEESSKTLKQIPSQGSLCKGNCKCNCLKPEDALKAYKEAAESDSYMFGEYNSYEAYGDIPD
jgi:hypothetical protein